MAYENAIQKLLVLLLALVCLSACSQQNFATQSGRSTANAIVNNTNTMSGTTCSTAIGRVYDSSSVSSSQTFEQRVKALLSASANPTSFGTIDGSQTATQTCVMMEGRLNYDSSGNVNASLSTLKLTIYDSYVGQKDTSGNTITPSVITFSSASSGQVDVNGKSFTLKFSDSYGEIDLTGNFAQTTTTGTMSFQNTTSFDQSASSSGVLGAFSIGTSAFVH